MNKIWIEKPSPKSLRIGTGWFANINHVYKFEDKYVCLTREIETKWGKVTHCAIRNASSTGSYENHISTICSRRINN